jgi:hypothetical protein
LEEEVGVFVLEHQGRPTSTQNAVDMIRDSTSRRKLTEADVLLCRARWLLGETIVALAREFGVGQVAMRLGASGLTYQDVAPYRPLDQLKIPGG